ncbi:MAG: hypothetical protein IT323_01880 [Anaerolineae bacterium]|nr:hypothetical protein [Anaerolineae bacterium]
MLKLTGFVLPDVGILTLTALAGKTNPADVTLDDLDRAADELEDFYSRGVGRSLAAGMVFPNSGFVQPEFDKPQFQHKRKAWANLVLRGHRGLDLEPALTALGKKEYRAMALRGVEGSPHCVFTGEPAYLRVSRDMLPMLNGRGVLNFGPMGEAGLPVSDVILLAIHAMPLGCVITQGALLAVESDDEALMAAFVRANLRENQLFINLAGQNGYEKFPNHSFYKSRLITVLVDALNQQDSYQGDDYRTPSLNAYHFSNYGTNARVSIYSLPSSTVQFVWEASKDEHRAVWMRIVAGSRTEDKPESEELQQKAPKLTQRNLIYEDLFELPGNARAFLRTYFLRRPLQKFKRGDPRNGYNLFTESDLVSWKLTALFLKRIMNMERTRIEHIRDLGDRLADYIQRYDRKLLNILYKGGSYRNFRDVMLRAVKNYARYAPAGSEPLISLEAYVQIFEEGVEFEKPDWTLARDLLLIRIFEQLHRSGYLSQVAPELQTEDESEEATPA